MKRVLWDTDRHAAGTSKKRRCILCGQTDKPDRMRECCGLFYCSSCFECSDVQDDSKHVYEVHS